MPGKSFAHNVIVANIVGELGQRLASLPCAVLPSDMRVHVKVTGLYTYPDAAVVCGELSFLHKEFDTLLNPTLIVEVLSPSTEAYDRGRKFDHYAWIETVAQYLLVASDCVHADLYTRQPGGSWLRTSANSPQDAIELQSIGCRLTLANLYEKVEFGGPPTASPGAPAA
jgi:Uma2 family endonuclease